jgi:Glycine rich protein
MLHLRRRFQPTIIRIVASTALACMGGVAFASASQAATVTFKYTGADVSYTISPGTYRISVFGAQGGGTAGELGLTDGGRGAEASAIYRIGQTLDLRIGVGGTAPTNEFAAGGGGASFVDFEVGDPGLTILLLVGGGGGGLTTTPLNRRSRGVTAKQHRRIREPTGRASVAAGEEDIPWMVNLSRWVAKAAQAWQAGARPGNSYRREDLAVAARAFSHTRSPGPMGAGVGVGLMAETRASATILANSSRPKAARRS